MIHGCFYQIILKNIILIKTKYFIEKEYDNGKDIGKDLLNMIDMFEQSNQG